jgi:hypothetical protein
MFLGHDAVWFGRWVSVIQRHMLSVVRILLSALKMDLKGSLECRYLGTDLHGITYKKAHNQKCCENSAELFSGIVLCLDS